MPRSKVELFVMDQIVENLCFKEKGVTIRNKGVYIFIGANN